MERGEWVESAGKREADGEQAEVKVRGGGRGNDEKEQAVDAAEEDEMREEKQMKVEMLNFSN